MQLKSFKPASYQPDLKLESLLQPLDPSTEKVPFDVVFVGAGPASLAGAIELARLCKKAQDAGEIGPIEIGILEKSANLGGHSLSGAVMNPRALKELFPEMDVTQFPMRGAVKGERVYFLTPTGKIRIPTPPTMMNHGNYHVSICELVKWMGEQAQSLGVNILTSFPAQNLLTENGKIAGVRTTPAGLGRDGQPKGEHMPSTDITAKITVLGEGTRGPLSQAYVEQHKLNRKTPTSFALGVKELWKVKKPLTHITHTLGWPLPTSAFGGSWMYPMGDDLVSVGLVVGLDYKESNLDVHNMLQKMKAHPYFKEVLDGGECIEWGAKTIPEGGLESFPERLSGDGIMMIGDSVGFVNVPALKGIHYAIQSGIYAARSAFEALKKQDFSGQQLKSYDETISKSYVYSDLKKVRNMRNAFKSGFVGGVIQAGLMTVSAGLFPLLGSAGHEDALEEKNVIPGQEAPVGMRKVDGVYLSGNKTRDDIPQHLIVGKDVPGEIADFYSALCPAGVYERQGDTLVVNAPNCVDCKATDVVGPRWTPREGGAGPDYKMM